MTSRRDSVKEYKARVMLAVNFINENISEKITLDDISKAACFSPFHFHRIFTAIVGETPVDFLNRVRLEKAANLLVLNPTLTITQTALQTGFSSTAVFSRAFKKHFNFSPSDWIKNSCSGKVSKNSKLNSKNRTGISFNEDYFNDADFGKNNLRRSIMKVEIKNLPGYHLAYFPQLDGYDAEKIGKAWEKICNWAASQNLMKKETAFIGISFDNPCVTPADKCRYYACVSVPLETEPPKGFGLIDIPAGKHAVSRYVGKGDNMGPAWSELYGQWLPSSGFLPTETPCFDIYYETPEQNKEGNFVMDLCVPVEPIK
jgi:AraC family transcriptional regulator